MTSSKFPLYLTDDEWRAIFAMCNGGVSDGAYSDGDLDTLIKLREQFEKLGFKP